MGSRQTYSAKTLRQNTYLRQWRPLHSGMGRSGRHFQCVGAAGNSQEPRPERRKRKRKNCLRTRRPVVIKRDNRNRHRQLDSIDLSDENHREISVPPRSATRLISQLLIASDSPRFPPSSSTRLTVSFVRPVPRAAESRRRAERMG